MIKKIFVVIGSVVILAIAYWFISPLWNTVTLDESMPTTIKDSDEENSHGIISESPMIAKAHTVEGTAFLIESGSQQYLRFEDLKTINGPNLHIYLSADLDATDFVDLGKIRATEGNVNYLIPPGTDLEKYKNALIWCKPFNVLFSYAQF